MRQTQLLSAPVVLHCPALDSLARSACKWTYIPQVRGYVISLFVVSRLIQLIKSLMGLKSSGISVFYQAQNTSTPSYSGLLVETSSVRCLWSEKRTDRLCWLVFNAPAVTCPRSRSGYRHRAWPRQTAYLGQQATADRHSSRCTA